MSTAGFKLVQLRNGTHAVHSAAYDETMHPGLGPAAEAEALYVRQLKIRERMQSHMDEFVVWDVGLGAAANALTLLWLTRDLKCPLRLVSFDDTSEPLAFALEHAAQLGYLRGYEATVRSLLDAGNARFTDGAHEVDWRFHGADFPALLTGKSGEPTHPYPLPRGELPSGALLSAPLLGGVGGGFTEFLPPPQAIMFDAFSPAKNPVMWTLPLFTNLFRLLDPARPCNLTTYSRSTMFRVTLLLAGFYVGRGLATGLKEETTVAANTLALLDDPLDRNWLERAHRSGSAEPLHEPAYRQGRLSAASWEKLQVHLQFRA